MTLRHKHLATPNFFKIRDGALYAQESGLQQTPLLHVPDLRIEKAVGKGAHAEVFAAVDGLGRTVALKVWLRASSQGIERARAEIAKLASLGPHPLFVVVHQLGISRGFPYAIMEYVSGISAKQWLAERHPNMSDRSLVWNLYSKARTKQAFFTATPIQGTFSFRKRSRKEL